MNTASALVAGVAALALATPALALTITNNDQTDNTVLLDEGLIEHEKLIPAGQTVKVSNDLCKEGCGITGPRGFTRMAVHGDSVSVTRGDVWGEFYKIPGS